MPLSYANLTICNCCLETIGFKKSPTVISQRGSTFLSLCHAPTFTYRPTHWCSAPEHKWRSCRSQTVVYLRDDLCSLLPRELKEVFLSILKMDHGGKCSVPGCTGNADSQSSYGTKHSTGMADVCLWEDPCEVWPSVLHLLEPFHQWQLTTGTRFSLLVIFSSI